MAENNIAQPIKTSTKDVRTKWSHSQKVLQDQAVDIANKKAQEQYAYAQQYHKQKAAREKSEREREEAVKQGIRVGVKSGDENRIANWEKEENDAQNNESSDLSDIDDAEIMNELKNQIAEKLDISAHKREEMLNEKQMKEKENYKQIQQYLAKGHGTLDEMNERDFLPMCEKTKFVVCMFYADTMQACEIMEKHLKIIAEKHVECRFAKMDARKSPFLVAKWKIRTLPTLCVIIDGYFCDKVIGFSEMGNNLEDVKTHVIAARLSKSGVISKPGSNKKTAKTKRTQTLID